MFWISFIIAVFATTFAYPIIKILFGAAYIKAVPVLQIYIWAGISVFLGVAVSQYLLAKNMAKITFYSTLLGAVVNIVLNLILIPKIGIAGGAVATFVAYSISTFGILFFKKSRNQSNLILKSIFNPK